jgi:ATP sulfurylase
MDVEQIARGVYSPLRGFMVQRDLESVLDDYRLQDGAIWTLPIIFQLSRDEAAKVQVGMSVQLRNTGENNPIGIFQIEDKYEVDLKGLTQRWFGTSDFSHPGVARVSNKGNWLLGGRVELAEHSREVSVYCLTPEQTRAVFTSKGWSRIVGFHTRNVPHRGHEYLISEALARSFADGVLIHPVIGPKKAGDFSAGTIIGAYNCIISDGLPHAMLAAFPTYSRYSGPREAVFTALCRKNYGCTHFIVGRDHTGVGKFYGELGAQQLFLQLGDLGIEPIFFGKVVHCRKCDKAVEFCEHGPSEFDEISGTNIRDSLRTGSDIQPWCLRPVLAQWLRKRIELGHSLFVGE